MGLFKRIFRRRRNNQSEDHWSEAPSTKQRRRQQQEQVPVFEYGQATASNQPEQRDDTVDVVSVAGTTELPIDAQLSRITEEPTIASSTTTGVPQPLLKRGLPPPAREAAFHGPPRFDWMDIEINAATKIQSIYRRNKVMNKLEKKGYSTSAIRNRKRRRKAARGRPIASADVPSFLSCCAVGLAFGDATEDDDEAYREFQKRQYEERVKQQQMHEDAIRKQYLRSQNAGIKVVEQIEVVE